MSIDKRRKHIGYPAYAPEVGMTATEMLDLIVDGITYYQPHCTHLGIRHSLKSECGSTDHTTHNLKTLWSVFKPGQTCTVHIFPPSKVLFCWHKEPADPNLPHLLGDAICYYATGYGVGYRGTGPTGLARLIAEGLGYFEFKDIMEVIAVCPSGYRGPLWASSGARILVNLRDEINARGE